MGSSLVTDEGGDSAVAPPTGDCIILRRFLASILFSAAFLFGFPSACMLAAVLVQGVRGVPSPWWYALIGCGIGWACGWLAILLWSDRRIPRWFLSAFMLTPCAVAGAACLVKADFEGGVFSIGMFLSAWWQIRSGLFGPKKLAMPEL